MKYLLYFTVFIVIISCGKDDWQADIKSCKLEEEILVDHSKSRQLQTIMDKLTALGIPGVSLAISTKEGNWAGASGFAKMETKTPMQPCHLQYSQSVSKTYLAVAILKMNELGKIDLDKTIDQYLDKTVSDKITRANEITVRMLMNHSSGIPEYNDKPAYVTFLLEHPLHEFSTLDYLHFVDGLPLVFEPGASYRYTNTNYELLALIGDFVSGDHARFIREQIFQPLELSQSYYHEEKDYLNKTDLVNSYWDRYSNGALENCTEMQKVNVGSLIGDDGIIATPFDFVRFLRSLFENKILSQNSMDQMLQLVKNDATKDYGYGLGISYDMYKGHPVYGHSGGGIGSGCYLRYFPENETYMFLAINIGTSVYSPIFDDAEGLIDEIYDVLVEE